MLRHSDPQKPPTTIETPAIGTWLLSRYILPKVALVLFLVSSAVGVWLTLEGIGAARLDLALAKWAQFVALSVLIGRSAWTGFHAGPHYIDKGFKAPMLFLQLQLSRFPAIQEYGMAALVGSGMYVLVAYSLHFGQRLGPWYNGLIGLQGLVLLVLANVVYLSAAEPQYKGQGLARLTVILSLLSLLFAAALDVVPYFGG